MSKETQPTSHPGEPEPAAASEDTQTVTLEGPGGAQISVTVTTENCEVPMVFVSAQGKIVGPVPLPVVFAAYVLGKLPQEAKIRSATDGGGWDPLSSIIPPLPPPPPVLTKLDMLREMALLQIPIMSAMLMPIMVSSIGSMNLSIILTIVASAALNTIDGIDLGCIPDKRYAVPLAFLAHLFLWPVAFPAYMRHRTTHGRVGFSVMPSISVGLLLGPVILGAAFP